MGFSIPVTGHAPIADEEQKEMLKLAKVLEVDEKSRLSKCGLSVISEMDNNVDDMDKLSSGEVEVNTTGLLEEWETRKTTKKKSKKKMPPQATRQSSRLKVHGGIPVGELAAKRKQKQNLEISGNQRPNPFTILNNIDDELLIKTAKDLDIHLASNDDDMVKQVTAMKPEEKLRAAMAEAAYQAHLDSLKHKECVRDDDGLDLNTIDNSSRDFPENNGSQPEQTPKGTKKKKT
jgi:hypothetical protein